MRDTELAGSGIGRFEKKAINRINQYVRCHIPLIRTIFVVFKTSI